MPIKHEGISNMIALNAVCLTDSTLISAETAVDRLMSLACILSLLNDEDQQDGSSVTSLYLS